MYNFAAYTENLQALHENFLGPATKMKTFEGTPLNPSVYENNARRFVFRARLSIFAA